MRLKSLFEHSGWKVMFWAALTWIGTSIPEWANLIEIAEPWDEIVTGFLSFVAAGIRLLVAHYKEPTVDATTLTVATRSALPERDRAKVAAAIASQE